MEPIIIYEDQDVIALDKPAGLLVHGARSMTHGSSLAAWLLPRYPEIRAVGDDPAIRPGIVHRLDRDTSGIMLVARNQRAFAYLKSLFQNHAIRKKYLAVVWGVPREREGVIDKPIGIKSGTTKRSIWSKKMAKPARTAYRVQKTFERDKSVFSLIEVSPETGRTHQIRVHLASIGTPIVGDSLYGKRAAPSWAGRMMLHALSVEFSLPTGSHLMLEAEPPPDFMF